MGISHEFPTNKVDFHALNVYIMPPHPREDTLHINLSILKVKWAYFIAKPRRSKHTNILWLSQII